MGDCMHDGVPPMMAPLDGHAFLPAPCMDTQGTQQMGTSNTYVCCRRCVVCGT